MLTFQPRYTCKARTFTRVVNAMLSRLLTFSTPEFNRDCRSEKMFRHLRPLPPGRLQHLELVSLSTHTFGEHTFLDGLRESSHFRPVGGFTQNSPSTIPGALVDGGII